MEITRCDFFLSSEEYRIYPSSFLIPLNSQVPTLPFTFTALRQLLNLQKARAHSHQSREKKRGPLWKYSNNLEIGDESPIRSMIRLGGGRCFLYHKDEKGARQYNIEKIIMLIYGLGRREGASRRLK